MEVQTEYVHKILRLSLKDKGMMTAVTFSIAVICLYVIAKLTYDMPLFMVISGDSHYNKSK